jgi:hypothetical protein
MTDRDRSHEFPRPDFGSLPIFAGLASPPDKPYYRPNANLPANRASLPSRSSTRRN